MLLGLREHHYSHLVHELRSKPFPLEHTIGLASVLCSFSLPPLAKSTDHLPVCFRKSEHGTCSRFFQMGDVPVRHPWNSPWRIEETTITTMASYQSYAMVSAVLYQYGRRNPWQHMTLGLFVFLGLACCWLGNLGKPMVHVLLDATWLLPRFISFGLECSLLSKPWGTAFSNVLDQKPPLDIELA